TLLQELGVLLAQASVLRLQFFQAALRLASGFWRVRHAFRVRPTIEQRRTDPQLGPLPWLHCVHSHATTPTPPFCTLRCISPYDEPASLTVSSCGLPFGF